VREASWATWAGSGDIKMSPAALNPGTHQSVPESCVFPSRLSTSLATITPSLVPLPCR
jgi:hypothetical protein